MAQFGYPGGFMGGRLGGLYPANNLLSDSNNLKKKWSFSKYAAISTGFSVFNGGSATMVSAPFGLQVNRRLNDNFYAFAGVAVAPTYTSFNRSFGAFDPYKTGTANSRIPNGFGVAARAEAGLMYINSERTFSISGSFGIERSSYPSFYNPTNNSFTPRPGHPVLMP
jgi:hypothetical protein